MPSRYDGIVAGLGGANETYDRERVRTLCEDFVSEIRGDSAACPRNAATRVLQLLRNHRYFALMDDVAEAIIESG